MFDIKRKIEYQLCLHQKLDHFGCSFEIRRLCLTSKYVNSKKVYKSDRFCLVYKSLNRIEIDPNKIEKS